MVSCGGGVRDGLRLSSQQARVGPVNSLDRDPSTPPEWAILGDEFANFEGKGVDVLCGVHSLPALQLGAIVEGV